jgi:D-alanine-D-alanine ligase
MDFIVTEEKKPYLIEVNTTPGMSERSIVPQQIAAAGKTMKSVFTELIQTI